MTTSRKPRAGLVDVVLGELAVEHLGELLRARAREGPH
jgi:hypothetical protein